MGVLFQKVLPAGHNAGEVIKDKNLIWEKELNIKNILREIKQILTLVCPLYPLNTHLSFLYFSLGMNPVSE